MVLVVVDNGSHSIKAGFVGDEEPRFVAPNRTARPAHQLRVLVADEMKAIADQSQLSFCDPFEHGLLSNADCLYDVWKRTFSQLDVFPGHNELLVTEAPLTPPSFSRALDEIVFEDFNFKASCRCPAQVLVEKSSSIVVDCGHSATHVVPIVRGKAITSASKRLEVGGKLLDAYVEQYEDSNSKIEDLLFAPHFANRPGIHEVVADALMSLNQRHRINAKIVLCGGLANLPGLEHKLKFLLRPLVPQSHNFKIEIVSEQPEFAAFRGGATVDPQSLPSVSREEWNEHGPRICAMRFKNYFLNASRSY